MEMAREEKPQASHEDSDNPKLRFQTAKTTSASRTNQPIEDRVDATLVNARRTNEFDSAFSLSPDGAVPTAELAVGSIISSQYKIRAKLGAGGMSHVYECEDMLVDRIVAVKVLRVDVSLVPHAATRFQREAKLVAMLEHPNIVKLYGLQLTEQK